MPGIQELIVIFLIVIVLFGSTRLPQLGRGLGEAISNFKGGLKSGEHELGPAETNGAEGEDVPPNPKTL